MASRSALLWMTHVWSAETAREFEKFYGMRDSATPEVWLLLDARTPGSNRIADRYRRCLVHEERALFDLPYPKLAGHGLIDHPHFPVWSFFLSHRDYDYYWVVEYDVRFTGQWERFLSSFGRYGHDLITSHIRRFDREPRWPWWGTLQHTGETIPQQKRLRSFNVIYRLSNRAMHYIHEAMAAGWRGYPEVLLPTLLFHGGFRLLDFGGKSEFTPPGNRNRFYTSFGMHTGNLCFMGTMRYQPARAKAGHRRNKLYHPVKPPGMLTSAATKRSLAGRWLREFGGYLRILCRKAG